MLLLDTTRKPHMGSPMTLSHLSLCDFERSKLKSLSISLRSRVWPHVTITHQQESLYGESIGASTFDFRDLERSMLRSVRFRRLISRK